MTIYCPMQSVEIKPGYWRHECPKCGEVRFGGRRYVRMCATAPPPAKPRGPCAHLGQFLRLEECATCGGKGKTKLKVFACGLHGECTRGKQLGELAVCQGCDDWRDPQAKPPGLMAFLPAWLRKRFG